MVTFDRAISMNFAKQNMHDNSTPGSIEGCKPVLCEVSQDAIALSNLK